MLEGPFEKETGMHDNPPSNPHRVLFVLFQMGTLDHVYALHRQLEAAGAVSHMSLADSSLSLPQWFIDQTPELTLVENPLDVIDNGDYDAVVMQMPYDDLKDPVWKEVGRDQAYTVYSGYGVFTVVWDYGEIGLPFYSRLSLVLASSPFQRDRFRFSPQAPAEAVWSGDPLMYELEGQESAPNDSRQVILWAPHWSETWVDGSPGFSTWKSTVHDVLAVAKARTDATIVVRGHPLMSTDGTDRRSRRSSRAFRELLALPNVTASTVSMREDIQTATALLTDGISIIPYFATTGRPLSVVRPGRRWPPYNSAGRAIVRSCDIVHNSRSIRQWLHKAADGRHPSSAERQDLVAQLFPLRRKSPGDFLLRSLPSAE